MSEFKEKKWRADCMRHWGKVLTGKQKHWCPAWDYLPIDETVREIECCVCVFNEKLNDNYRDVW